jgi:hypothetical protein
MALKTFTATRPPAAGDGKRLASWHLSCGATTALIVNFCDGTSATPLFQVQVPVTASASQAYSQPMPIFPNGLHVEVVSGNFTRGAVDLI